MLRESTQSLLIAGYLVFSDCGFFKVKNCNPQVGLTKKSSSRRLQIMFGKNGYIYCNKNHNDREQGKNIKGNSQCKINREMARPE